MPVGKNGRGRGAERLWRRGVATPVETFVPPEEVVPAATESFTEGVGEPSFVEPNESVEFSPEVSTEPIVFDDVAPVGTFAAEPTEAEFVEAPMEVAEPIWEAVEAFDEPDIEEAMAFAEEAPPEFAELTASPIMSSDWMAEAITSMDEVSEPIGQGQPIPYLIPATSADALVVQITEPDVEMLPADFAAAAAFAGLGALSHSLDKSSFAPQVISTEPLAQQPTTPATMPQPTPTNTRSRNSNRPGT